MSTLTTDGHPYTSLAPFSLLDDGSPLICISELAEHTHNLRADCRASLLVDQQPDAGVDVDPLSLARVTILGSFVTHHPDATAIDRHLTAHPHARHYVGFDDFTWWKLDVAQLRYVGGFGVMGWTDAAEFAAAAPDPVIPHAARMIDHLNVDHADACIDIVRRLASVTDARSAVVSGIDRYGITFEARSATGSSVVARVAFAAPLGAADDVRGASVELVRRARADD